MQPIIGTFLNYSRQDRFLPFKNLIGKRSESLQAWSIPDREEQHL